MRTVLPLPEQIGFRVWLPPRIRFARRTQVVEDDTALLLRRNEITLTVTVPAQARQALAAALDHGGTGLETRQLSTTWRQLLEKFAVAGMLADTARPEDGVSSIDTLRAIADGIYDSVKRNFSGTNRFAELIDGRCDRETVTAWLIENYYYTKSAAYHIPPVLRHDMTGQEQALWSRFLKDESWHWRIYRPALAQLGLSTADLDNRTPHPATTRFIELLHTISSRSPIAYAAAMNYIEKPPTAADADSDPLYSSLQRHYGFTARAIRPLWWHATENQSAGHSDLGSVVISNRHTISIRDHDAAMAAVGDIVQCTRDWHDQVLAPA